MTHQNDDTHRNLAIELIERAERESGRRWDDPDGAGLAVILGALARELDAVGEGPLGRTRAQGFRERDDYAIGMLIHDRMINGDARRAAAAALLALLDLGLSPDDIHALNGDT